MAESDASTISIEYYPSKVFSKFIEFCYTGEIKQDQEFQAGDILDLLDLACQYCMDDLRQILEQHLLKDVNPTTVCDLLGVALNYELNGLRHEIWRKILLNKQEYKQMGAFKFIYETDPEFKGFKI